MLFSCVYTWQPERRKGHYGLVDGAGQWRVRAGGE
jgi:hypothetical protein